MADAGYLTIGKVVTKLQGQYPDLSVSKIRYLEDEGLLNPSRTPGGYRLYSSRDIKRLDTILYLQKTRFLPLSVIKDELDREDSPDAAMSPSVMDGVFPAPSYDDEETTNKLHDIENMPDLLGVSVSFVRQLSEVGAIELKRSPHGRDLVDGHDFALIRAANDLRRFGIEPRNLRQYVTAANRESPMFDQALVAYARHGAEPTDVQKEEFEAAFNRILILTSAIRSCLIKRMVKDSFKSMDV